MRYLITISFVLLSTLVEARRVSGFEHLPNGYEETVLTVMDLEEETQLEINDYKAEDGKMMVSFPWLALVSLLGLVAFKIIESMVLTLKEETRTYYQDKVTIKFGAKPMA